MLLDYLGLIVDVNIRRICNQVADAWSDLGRKGREGKRNREEKSIFGRRKKLGRKC